MGFGGGGDGSFLICADWNMRPVRSAGHSAEEKFVLK